MFLFQSNIPKQIEHGGIEIKFTAFAHSTKIQYFSSNMLNMIQLLSDMQQFITITMGNLRGSVRT